jgi:hypothetical protein
MNPICRVLIVLCSLVCVARAQMEWSWRTPPGVMGLTYGDGQFVAVGTYDGIFSSKNGQTWTTQLLWFLRDAISSMSPISPGDGGGWWGRKSAGIG